MDPVIGVNGPIFQCRQLKLAKMGKKGFINPAF
jgi:hypothetical protein